MDDSSRSSPVWIDGDKKRVTMQNIIEGINAYPQATVSVGCDSHYVGGKYLFAVVIAVHIPRSGGFFYFTRKKRNEKALRDIMYRLMEETRMSIDVACLIRSIIGYDRKIDVHLDINTNSKFASFPVLQPASSWVKSMGFTAVAKPDAWAASGLADSFAK